MLAQSVKFPKEGSGKRDALDTPLTYETTGVLRVLLLLARPPETIGIFILLSTSL